MVMGPKGQRYFNWNKYDDFTSASTPPSTTYWTTTLVGNGTAVTSGGTLTLSTSSSGAGSSGTATVVSKIFPFNKHATFVFQWATTNSNSGSASGSVQIGNSTDGFTTLFSLVRQANWSLTTVNLVVIALGGNRYYANNTLLVLPNGFGIKCTVSSSAGAGESGAANITMSQTYYEAG